MSETIGTILASLQKEVGPELYESVSQVIRDGFNTMDKLREKLEAHDDEIRRLRAALVEIAQHAPIQEPTQPNHPQNLPQAWAYWVAGNLAKRVLGQE